MDTYAYGIIRVSLCGRTIKVASMLKHFGCYLGCEYKERMLSRRVRRATCSWDSGNGLSDVPVSSPLCGKSEEVSREVDTPFNARHAQSRSLGFVGARVRPPGSRSE